MTVDKVKAKKKRKAKKKQKKKKRLSVKGLFHQKKASKAAATATTAVCIDSQTTIT